MSWQKIAAFAVGIGAVVGGAFLLTVNPIAGAAVMSAGTGWLGTLRAQPDFMAPQK